jgi:hypothetical protein
MTARPSWSTLSLDQSVALRTSAGHLADDFAGIYGTETIQRCGNSLRDWSL